MNISALQFEQFHSVVVSACGGRELAVFSTLDIDVSVSSLCDSSDT